MDDYKNPKPGKTYISPSLKGFSVAEIITFDELYERARFIVSQHEADHAYEGPTPLGPEDQ